METQPLLVRIQGVGGRQRTAWLLWLFLVAVVPGGRAQDASSAPDVEAIVARMAQARADNRAHFRPYTVTRDYKLFGKERQDPDAKSQVTADVAFVPPNHIQYAIEQTNGTGWGEKIVRRILANEAKIAKEYAATEISPANYEFRFLRVEDVTGQRCYLLEVLPKRKDKHLLRGNIWVDANTYLLRRTEGKPAKSPSWWVREVRFVLLYGDVAGMWLQTASEATANVRIVGQYTLVSRDVKYEIGELVAAGSLAQTSFSVGERTAKDQR